MNEEVTFEKQTGPVWLSSVGKRDGSVEGREKKDEEPKAALGSGGSTRSGHWQQSTERGMYLVPPYRSSTAYLLGAFGWCVRRVTPLRCI